MSDTEYQPLKGDPDLLIAKAAHYAHIADAIQRSAVTLRKIHDVDDMRSQATAKLRDSSDDVANDILKAHDRYATTAEALTTYAGKLRHAQEAATTAIAHIAAKEQDAETAHTQATQAQQHADSATDDQKASATTAATQAQQDAKTADSAVGDAQQEWRDALAIKNAAAQDAIKAIVEVVDHHNNGLKNPGFWEKLGKTVLDVVKKICEVAGFLSIFLSWVPILGAVLVGLAILGAVITLVESIVSAVNGGSWTDVLFAAVGVVLTAFGGKFASYLGKLVKFQAASKVMTKGDDFLNSKGFKAVFGESKAALRGGKLKPLFKDGPGFKTMMKDIRNPFDLKLGKGRTLWGKFTDGASTEWSKVLKNPLGLKSVELGGPVLKLAPMTPAKVGMVVMDARSVLSKVQTLVNTPQDIFSDDPHKISITPDKLLQQGAGAAESAIRTDIDQARVEGNVRREEARTP